MGMNLVRVGGRDDRGLDICGTWSPPTSPGLPRPKLQVYVQCKAERTRTGPKYLRELEGTLGISSTPDTPPIGILAATRPCTPGLRKHMLLSRMPLAYCCIAPYDQGGYVRQFLWNGEVGRLIGRGVGATTRYIREDGNREGKEIRMEAVLTVDGQIVDFVDDGQKMIPG
ncbi:hypothetical protein K440DRAFT_620192 [Wilcoxina mikolae CBS 423.85]|nr:hypothetical protein K440DRAFT_620192 [Wilcoxina mikolae CBS 423.85]